MRLFSRLLSVTIILGAVAAMCPSANAGAFNYPGKRKRINCGIVGLFAGLRAGTDKRVYTNDGAIDQVLPNAQINLFTKLDALTGMKPTGWTLENPLAATTNKFDRDYWIVPINSSRNLSRMDVLYFPAAGKVSLTDDEREALRKFVDGGGVLWVDNADSANPLKFDLNNPLFITQCQFIKGTSSLTAGDAPVSRHHPLVSSPFWLTDIDMMSLGMTAYDSSWASCYYDLPGNGLPTQEPISYDFLYQVIDSVDGTGLSHPSVVSNNYGSGRVVATARFVGRACLLPEPYSLPSLKLAYNIMSYGSSWPDIRKGPRHSGASIDTLGNNKLVEKWSFLTDGPKSISAEANKENAPVLYKNTVFYTHGSTLYALDANGNDNFGMYPRGPNGEVVIWSWTDPAGGRLSAPSVATVQNPDPNAPNDCGPIEAVMVQSTAACVGCNSGGGSNSGGAVYILPAFPLNPDGTVNGPITPIFGFDTQGGSSGADSKWPCPPLYIDGWFYAISGQGRLFAKNPCLLKYQAKKGTGTTATPGETLGEWTIPDMTADPGYKSVPRSGPAFAYMKGIYNGAIVGSVWWYTGPDTNPLKTHATENDHLWAVPVSVSNDRVKITSRSGNESELFVSFPGYIHAPDATNTMSAVRIYDSDGVTAITQTGQPELNRMLANRTAPTPGYMIVKTNVPLPTSPRIYASYTLTYGPGVNVTHNMEIDPKIPVSTTPSASITHEQTLIKGLPAIGPDNMTYTCGYRKPGTDVDGGSILAYTHDGTTGNGRLKWHYFLHSGLDATVGPSYIPGTTVQIPGVVWDKDTNLSMIHPEPSSSPAISNGKVFVTVSGEDTGGKNPRGALLCLKATPEFIIRITKSGGYGPSGAPIRSSKSLYRDGDSGHDNGRYRVRIWQPNLINTPTGAAPMMDARDVTGGATVDYDNGTITFTDFTQPKLQTMGGVETNTFTPSLPVWVYLDNVEVPIDWGTWGPGAYEAAKPLTAATSDAVDLSSWNNLLWYYIIPDYEGKPCSGAHSPPTVIGNTVYFTTDDGILYALDAETGESKGQQTKQKALWVQKLETDPNSMMPAESAVSVAGSNGVLMVPGPNGLHAYTTTTTLVTDNNRLVEVDGNGDPSWSVDSITWPATTPSASGNQMAVKQGPVNKPGNARYASTGEILFANTGADQVCKIDKSGMIGFDGAMGLYARWIYEKFADPKGLLSSGQPLKLRGPTDAIMWQEMEPSGSSGAPSSVVHCLIADSGNSRILDLVYRMKAGALTKWDGNRIDPASNPQDQQYIDQESGFVLPELNWVSKTDALNEKYAYSCMQLVNVVKNSTTYCQDIWVASSNLASTGTDIVGTSPSGTAGLGGAIMAIGYRQRSMGSSTSAPGVWDYGQPTSGSIVARCDHVMMNGQSVPLANPRYFTVVDDVVNNKSFRSLLICDNYGVYQVSLQSGAAIPPVMTTDPADSTLAINPLWVKNYPLLRRLEDPRSTIKDPTCGNYSTTPLDPVPLPSTVPLIASSVQRLPNRKWLITNSYVGSNSSGSQSFNGEVFEYDPRGPTDQQVLWCSPKLEWVPPVGAPPCTVPTIWRQVNTTTYNLRQPKTAIRQ